MIKKIISSISLEIVSDSVTPVYTLLSLYTGPFEAV